MSDPIISIRGVGKRFVLGESAGHDTLRDHLAAGMRRIIGRKKTTRPATEHWALRDVSFDVNQGEVVGIIGNNGAGKSTLLKILSQISEPTEGEIRVRGRIASLLEVGTGFHPELTGRENVFLNGAILGMAQREIRKKFGEIVEFSQVGEFLDTPVKHYSSGMQVRLAFAVAAFLEQEVLLVDEVLAVGDAAFQRKCLGKMREVAGSGRTVIFISHQLGTVKSLCSRGIVLDRGRVRMDASVHDAVEYYLKSTSELVARRRHFDDNPVQAIVPLELAIHCPDKTPEEPFDIADTLEVEVRYRVHADIHGVNLAIHLVRDGSIIFKSFDTDLDTDAFGLRKAGDYLTRIRLPVKLLTAGRYTIEATAGRPNVGYFSRTPAQLSFDIEENSEDVTRKSYAAKRQALLILPLAWKQQYLETNQPQP